MFKVIALLLALPLGACSSDIFDVNVQLMAQSFRADFGAAAGTVPTVSCSAQTTASCGGGQVIALEDDAGEVTIMPGCDAGASRCFVQASAVVRYTLNVLQDESFTDKVARRSVSAVRMLDITYRIPVNTTTFDIPKIDVLVGPAGSRVPTDPGMFLVDTVESLQARTVFVDQPRHLTVTDGSPARDLIERNIKAKTAFVFMLTITPRLESGTPVPAGTLQVELTPLLGLGLR